MYCDVLVLGGGAAGAAAAVTCARAGAVVVVADRPARRAPIGECLSPQGRPLLRATWPGFDFASHPLYVGSRAAWSGDALEGRGFLFNPYGSGLRLDRRAFDLELRTAVCAEGATALQVGRFLKVSGGAGAWQIQLETEGRICSVHAGFVIDCTGRNSAFARALGVRRVSHDRLIGLVVLAERLDQDQGWLTVEATPFGWWYTVEAPEHGRLVALMIDADIARELRARTADGFRRLLSSTDNIGCCRIDGTEQVPVAVAASTSRLLQVSGAGWCAAGDAAATHDPLSAQGIVSAMKSGRAAAAAALSGDTSSYAKAAEVAFNNYLATRQHVYADNKRWWNSPFWRRRTPPTEVLV